MKTPSRPDVVTAAVPPGVKPTGWQVSGRGEYAQDMLRRFPARIAAPCPDLGAHLINQPFSQIVDQDILQRQAFIPALQQ